MGGPNVQWRCGAQLPLAGLSQPGLHLLLHFATRSGSIEGMLFLKAILLKGANMRLTLTVFILSVATIPALAHDILRRSEGVGVQLPREVVARLPAPQKPGDMRRAYLKDHEKRTK